MKLRCFLAWMLMALVTLFPLSGMAFTCPMMAAPQAVEKPSPCHDSMPQAPVKQRQSKSCCGGFACQACTSQGVTSQNIVPWRLERENAIRYVSASANFASHIPEYLDPPPK